MAKKKATKAETPQTTAQSLGSVVKSCRDIMRKDKGLNGDLDRLPMLTWIMFLKVLDDMERLREQEASLSNERFRPVIAAPYRWRDWAAKPDGITGPELIAFINQEKAVRADGKEGPGLFAYLRSLESPEGRGRQEVVANVFRGVSNRMESGYLLRDVLNKVHAIHFDSSEEIHTLSRLYESMLREMRDAAGDSGEFYTPRPVVQFMVEVMNPQLGETVLDPACGTGGFLVESFMHMSKQCKTTKDRQALHTKSIFGKEAKPLPYLLCEMNLLLHGMESPQIDYANSLAVKVTEIGDRDRVDVILTNPPFGGEEEASIKAGFPQDMQTAETVLLFLQLIMRMLRRPKGTTSGGRAAVVVPNGLLSAGSVAMRIRRELLSQFNLHTIVRLPQNVFAPYTDVATNILFFDRNGPTRTIQYCQVSLPTGTTLSKTRPLEVSALSPVAKLIKQRKTSAHSWIVNVSELGDDVDLDIKNPTTSLDTILPAGELINQLESKLVDQERNLRTLRNNVRSVLNTLENVPLALLGDITFESDDRIGTEYTPDIRLVGVTNVAGITTPKTPIGKDPTKYKRVRLGDLVYNPMRINVGSVGVSLSEDQTGITSPDYVVFTCKPEVLPEYVYHFLRSDAGQNEIARKTRGSVRFRLYYDRLATVAIPLPSVTAQEDIVRLCRTNIDVMECFRASAGAAENCLSAILREVFLRPQ